MELEKKIRTYLKENGINQAFVAKLLNLSPANLGAMLNGKRRMKADELIIFCQHYGLDISFFKNETLAGVSNG